jgi:hypothetical protein
MHFCLEKGAMDVFSINTTAKSCKDWMCHHGEHHVPHAMFSAMHQ